VFVCVPPLAHREVAVAALEKGINVYLEKPIARGLEDARAIVDAAARSSSVCAVGYQWRAVEVLDDLRETLAGQEIGMQIGISFGPTKSRPWFLDRAQGGGNLLERASHTIDLERAIGGEVVAVKAAASRVLLAQSQGEHGDIEDAAALVLNFAGHHPGRLAAGGPSGQILPGRPRQRLGPPSRARPRLRAEGTVSWTIGGGHLAAASGRTQRGSLPRGGA